MIKGFLEAHMPVTLQLKEFGPMSAYVCGCDWISVSIESAMSVIGIADKWHVVGPQLNF